MKLTFTLLAAALLTACALSPAQQSALVSTFNDQLVSGQITREQYDALIAALSAGNYQGITEILVSTGLSIVGALTGVRIWRGGVHSRNGEMPSPVSPGEQQG